MDEQTDYSKYLNQYNKALQVNDQKKFDQIIEEDAEKAFKILCQKLKWAEHLVYADYNYMYKLYISNVGKIKLCSRKISYDLVSKFLPPKTWQKVSKYIAENKTMPMPELKIKYGFYQRDKSGRKSFSTVVKTYEEITSGKMILDKKNFILTYYVPPPKAEETEDYQFFKSVLVDVYGVQNLDYFLDWLAMYTFEIKTDAKKYTLQIKGVPNQNKFSLYLLKAIYPASYQLNPVNKKIDYSSKLVIYHGKKTKTIPKIVKSDGDAWFAFFNDRTYPRSRIFSIEEDGDKKIHQTDEEYSDLIKRNIGRLVEKELFQRFSDICYYNCNNKNIFGFNKKKNEQKWKVAKLVNELISMAINLIEVDKLKKIIKKHFKQAIVAHGISVQLTKSGFIKEKKLDVNSGKQYYVLDPINYNKQQILTIKSQNILEWSL